MNSTSEAAADAAFAQIRLARLGAWCVDHRRAVLVAWLAGVLAVVALATLVGSRFENDFGGAGESQQARALLAARFPAHSGDQAQVVFAARAPLASAALAGRIDHALDAIRTLPSVTEVSPLTVSAHGRIGFATVDFDAITAKLPAADIKRVIATARSYAELGRLQVALGGEPIGAVVSPSPGPSEAIGIGAAVVIMLLAFGSVVAMGLPLLTALAGVGVGYGVVALVSRAVIDPSFGPELMAMIGLGVGIDYALFLVTRFRQELRDGREPRAAVMAAMATAGRAVLFAGSTVLISLCGLFAVGQSFLDGLALGTMLAVLAVMAAALTLLPAVLGYCGRAIDRARLPGRRREAQRPARATTGLWRRWSRTVQRRPLLCGTAALAVLVSLAIPLFSMRLAFTDAGNDPTGLTTRQAYDLLSDGFGPGFTGPLVLAADLRNGAHRDAERGVVSAAARAVAASPGVARVQPPAYNAAGDAAVVTVYPSSAPQAAATATLVQRLRHVVIPRAVAGSGVRVLVGGQTAAGIDSAAQLSARLRVVIALVIAVSFVLLMAVFRSLAIAVKAALMNLLSIGAAYGAIVAVYQWGWLSDVFPVGRPGPIDPWIPLMMFTITFGLSMDYEVFLLSRIQEAWHRQVSDTEAGIRAHDARAANSAAVTDGLASTGRVITAAAAIMVCVFASFVIGDPLRILDVFGLGLAVAIFVDATVVRMVLVPALMQLLGRANWWLPRWLDRLLPHLDVDGARAVGAALVPEPAAWRRRAGNTADT
jgi:RND superfamily putative drug exporter